MGKALSETGEAKAGEEAYRKATQINSTDPTAWQGLVYLFEQTWQVDEYLDVVKELGIIFMKKWVLTISGYFSLFRKNSSNFEL